MLWLEAHSQKCNHIRMSVALLLKLQGIQTRAFMCMVMHVCPADFVAEIILPGICRNCRNLSQPSSFEQSPAAQLYEARIESNRELGIPGIPGIPTSLLPSIWSCQTSAMAPWKDLDYNGSVGSVSTGECTSKGLLRKKRCVYKLLKTSFAKANTTEYLAHHLLPPDLVWICRMLHQPWAVKAGNFFRHHKS